MSKKGPQWERDVAVVLSRWWSSGQDDSLFWRTSQSGGRATTRLKKGKATKGHYGDLCGTDPSAQPFFDVFTVEVKRGYSSSSPFDLLDRGPRSLSKLYLDWITKLEATAVEAGSFSWMLIVKRDKREPFVLMPHEVWEEIPSAPRSFYPHCQMNLDLTSRRLLLNATRLDLFLSLYDPECVRLLASIHRQKRDSA